MTKRINKIDQTDYVATAQFLQQFLYKGNCCEDFVLITSISINWQLKIGFLCLQLGASWVQLFLQNILEGWLSSDTGGSKRYSQNSLLRNSDVYTSLRSCPLNSQMLQKYSSDLSIHCQHLYKVLKVLRQHQLYHICQMSKCSFRHNRVSRTNHWLVGVSQPHF